jgi:hypothetical protein
LSSSERDTRRDKPRCLGSLPVPLSSLADSGALPRCSFRSWRSSLEFALVQRRTRSGRTRLQSCSSSRIACIAFDFAMASSVCQPSSFGAFGRLFRPLSVSSANIAATALRAGISRPQASRAASPSYQSDGTTEEVQCRLHGKSGFWASSQNDKVPAGYFPACPAMARNQVSTPSPREHSPPQA